MSSHNTIEHEDNDSSFVKLENQIDYCNRRTEFYAQHCYVYVMCYINLTIKLKCVADEERGGERKYCSLYLESEELSPSKL